MAPFGEADKFVICGVAALVRDGPAIGGRTTPCVVARDRAAMRGRPLSLAAHCIGRLHQCNESTRMSSSSMVARVGVERLME